PIALASRVPAAPRGVSRCARASRTPAPRITRPPSMAAARAKRRELAGAPVRGTPPDGLRAINNPRSALHPGHGTRFLDGHGYGARSSLFKIQGQAERLTLAQRLLKPHQHDVLAAGLQRNRLAGRNVEAGERAHFHD